MSDAHERPMISRNVEQDHPYAGLEQFWNFEVERRRLRERSYTKLAVGLSGAGGAAILTLFLLASAGYLGGLFLALAVVCALVGGVSSLWLAVEGVQGLGASRQLPPPQTHRAIRSSRQRGKRSDEPAERQLLEVIERNGEITPARAALQTSLTVDEAERLLSELAQRGHLDVRVEGSKLVYSL